MSERETVHLLHDSSEKEKRTYTYCFLHFDLSDSQYRDLAYALSNGVSRVQLVTGTETSTLVFTNRVIVSWNHPNVEDIKKLGQQRASIETTLEQHLVNNLAKVMGWDIPMLPDVKLIVSRKAARKLGFKF